MPELPEVETTRRGIEPHLLEKKILEVIVRRRDLRQPITPGIDQIEGQLVSKVRRRSKYLLLDIGNHVLLIHLGMSGSLRIIDPAEAWKKHDHFALTVNGGKQLRLHDPRRFGLVLLIEKHAEEKHPLLAKLGPEPLEPSFTATGLLKTCTKRSTAIKSVIMDAKVVVGVGNIYASEALFRAGIRPTTHANRISSVKMKKLADAIRAVLTDAIQEGGTTLRDFLNSDGQPGYFRQRLFVYDRKGDPCRICGTAIAHAVIAQRATYWCPKCQR